MLLADSTDEQLNIGDLILKAGYVGHYKLSQKLMELAIFDETKETRKTLYFKLFLDRVLRHDSASIKNMVATLPDIQEVLIKELSEYQKQELIKAMFISFLDIIDTETLTYLNKELGLGLIPVINKTEGQLVLTNTKQ